MTFISRITLHSALMLYVEARSSSLSRFSCRDVTAFKSFCHARRPIACLWSSAVGCDNDKRPGYILGIGLTQFIVTALHRDFYDVQHNRLQLYSDL